ncbi:MAG TPA: F0F1 ATP synthase subunit A, partial [Anaerolineales bacterium]
MEKTVEASTPKKKWRRWGVNRWIVLALIILGFIGAKYFSPVRPFVQLPAEHWMEHPLFTLPVIGDFYFTNTLFALLIVDVLVILLAFFFNRAVKRGNLVLKGIPGALEALLEALYNMTEGTAGKKWAKTIFPWFATITILVLFANWMELIPGVDSIGMIEKAEG